jgi:hypothetical protein
MDATASRATAEYREQRENEASPAHAASPDWFPNWSGQACAIIATGQSAKNANIGLLKGRVKVIAIKEAAVDLCPWADVAYGCDAPWWKHRKGLPEFAGLKIGWDEKIPFQDVRRIKIKRALPNGYVDKILTDQPGVIGGGQNSGFQAANLAIQFGANRIMLIGFDLSGEHYYGRNDWFKAGNPDKSVFDACIKTWADNADLLRSLGVQVINTNNGSALRCFPKHSIDDAMKSWDI